MAKVKYKTYEEAVAAQKTAKIAVKNSKQELTSYLKQNKLKRNVDHSDDKKHGKKIGILNNKIDKAVKSLEKINESVTSLKPEKVRATKYDYPEGLTAEEKKKFRQAARQKAKAGDKPKKKKKASKEKVEDAPKKSSKKTSKKKSSKKKTKKSDD